MDSAHARSSVVALLDGAIAAAPCPTKAGVLGIARTTLAFAPKPATSASRRTPAAMLVVDNEAGVVDRCSRTAGRLNAWECLFEVGPPLVDDLDHTQISRRRPSGRDQTTDERFGHLAATSKTQFHAADTSTSRIEPAE